MSSFFSFPFFLSFPPYVPNTLWLAKTSPAVSWQTILPVDNFIFKYESYVKNFNGIYTKVQFEITFPLQIAKLKWWLYYAEREWEIERDRWSHQYRSGDGLRASGKRRHKRGGKDITRKEGKERRKLIRQNGSSAKTLNDDTKLKMPSKEGTPQVQWRSFSSKGHILAKL